MTPTRITLALALLLASACDLCGPAREYHEARCAAGDPDSCAWLQSHTDPTTGQSTCE